MLKAGNKKIDVDRFYQQTHDGSTSSADNDRIDPDPDNYYGGNYYRGHRFFRRQETQPRNSERHDQDHQQCLYYKNIQGKQTKNVTGKNNGCDYKKRIPCFADLNGKYFFLCIAVSFIETGNAVIILLVDIVVVWCHGGGVLHKIIKGSPGRLPLNKFPDQNPLGGTSSFKSLFSMSFRLA